MGRTQTERITIRLTPDEKYELEADMYRAAAPSMRQFILDMCRDGKIVVNEDLRVANVELRYQGNNLNQLTKLAHQGGVQVVNLGEVLACYREILEAIQTAGSAGKQEGRHGDC